MSLQERLEAREERLHVPIGAICNNNCIFCMEENREGRYVANSAMTAERVNAILSENIGAEEVCFTSGEPTTRPELPAFAAHARSLGYRRISVMTNGRRLSHLPYAASLLQGGMNRFYVSIHGHTAKLHEGLTRTPDSFAQTVAGLRVLQKLKRFTIETHTSTVVTERNLPFLRDIYTFLRGLGVDQVVFNVMQANGRANTYFDQIFPRYTEIAARFTELVTSAPDGGDPPRAFLVDIPACTTESVPDFNRGFIEKAVRHNAAAPMVPAEMDFGDAQPGQYLREWSGGATARAPEIVTDTKDGRRALVVLRRADLDESERVKRAECSACRHDPHCEGVWRNYVSHNGWDEFEPVARAESAVG